MHGLFLSLKNLYGKVGENGMTVFRAVKEHVTTRQAAERYGIKVSRDGICCCPFHNDRHPNMKVYSRYYCFACNCTGDVIDFTAFLFHMEPLKAAMKLAEDFGVDYEYKGRPSESSRGRVEKNQSSVNMAKKSDEQIFKEKRVKATRAYLRYLSDLNDQKERYAPKREREEWPKDFVQILSLLTTVEYYLDILLFGDKADQKDLIKEKVEEVDELAKKYGLS